MNNQEDVYLDGLKLPREIPINTQMTYEKLEKVIEVFKTNGVSYKDVEKAFNKQFWDGFDACLEMVFNSLDSQDSNEIARFSVWEFIEDFKHHLFEEAQLYKTDG